MVQGGKGGSCIEGGVEAGEVEGRQEEEIFAVRLPFPSSPPYPLWLQRSPERSSPSRQAMPMAPCDTAGSISSAAAAVGGRAAHTHAGGS